MLRDKYTFRTNLGWRDSARVWMLRYSYKVNRARRTWIQKSRGEHIITVSDVPGDTCCNQGTPEARVVSRVEVGRSVRGQ